jgi:hypothetical protein
MHRRDLLLFRPDPGKKVFELACERLYMRYLDSRRPRSPATTLDEYWLGEPEPHITSPGTRELFDGLRRDLAGVDVLRVVGQEWLADTDRRREVDALAAALRASGGRVEFIADVPPVDPNIAHIHGLA